MSQQKARILLVDDHPIVLEGLALRINGQPDLEVCGEATGLADARKAAAECEPDLAVIDLMLKDGSGLELIRDLLAQHPRLRALALSMHDERLFAPRALAAGARGYLMKHEATEKILEAIRQVLAGHVYLSEAMRVRLLDNLARGEVPADQSPMNLLSDRELEVFRLVGEGLETREIAARLQLSVKTVETYYERIKNRLGLASRAEILRHAVLWIIGAQQ